METENQKKRDQLFEYLKNTSDSPDEIITYAKELGLDNDTIGVLAFLAAKEIAFNQTNDHNKETDLQDILNDKTLNEEITIYVPLMTDEETEIYAKYINTNSYELTRYKHNNLFVLHFTSENDSIINLNQELVNLNHIKSLHKITKAATATRDNILLVFDKYEENGTLDNGLRNDIAKEIENYIHITDDTIKRITIERRKEYYKANNERYKATIALIKEVIYQEIMESSEYYIIGSKEKSFVCQIDKSYYIYRYDSQNHKDFLHMINYIDSKLNHLENSLYEYYNAAMTNKPIVNNNFFNTKIDLITETLQSIHPLFKNTTIATQYLAQIIFTYFRNEANTYIELTSDITFDKESFPHVYSPTTINNLFLPILSKLECNDNNFKLSPTMICDNINMVFRFVQRTSDKLSGTNHSVLIRKYNNRKFFPFLHSILKLITNSFSPLYYQNMLNWDQIYEYYISNPENQALYNICKPPKHIPLHEYTESILKQHAKDVSGNHMVYIPVDYTDEFVFYSKEDDNLIHNIFQSDTEGTDIKRPVIESSQLNQLNKYFPKKTLNIADISEVLLVHTFEQIIFNEYLDIIKNETWFIKCSACKTIITVNNRKVRYCDNIACKQRRDAKYQMNAISNPIKNNYKNNSDRIRNKLKKNNFPQKEIIFKMKQWSDKALPDMHDYYDKYENSKTSIEKNNIVEKFKNRLKSIESEIFDIE